MIPLILGAELVDGWGSYDVPVLPSDINPWREFADAVLDGYVRREFEYPVLASPASCSDESIEGAVGVLKHRPVAYAVGLLDV